MAKYHSVQRIAQFRYHKQLRRCGFLRGRKSTYRLSIKSFTPRIPAGTLTDIKDWFLTYGDAAEI